MHESPDRRVPVPHLMCYGYELLRGAGLRHACEPPVLLAVTITGVLAGIAALAFPGGLCPAPYWVPQSVLMVASGCVR